MASAQRLTQSSQQWTSATRALTTSSFPLPHAAINGVHCCSSMDISQQQCNISEAINVLPHHAAEVSTQCSAVNEIRDALHACCCMSAGDSPFAKSPRYKMMVNLLDARHGKKLWFERLALHTMQQIQSTPLCWHSLLGIPGVQMFRRIPVKTKHCSSSHSSLQGTRAHSLCPHGLQRQPT